MLSFSSLLLCAIVALTVGTQEDDELLLLNYAHFEHNEVNFDLSRVKLKHYINQEWEIFKETYGKTYEDHYEHAKRFRIYKKNFRKVARHNELYETGKTGFKMALNKFADLNPSEFRKSRLMSQHFKPDGKQRGRTLESHLKQMGYENSPIPNEIDWRQKGYVTDVKDQGECGSCWAFATTGVIEGQQFKKSGKLVSLSEQNLMECSLYYGNAACYGGLMYKALNYVKEQGGIDTEESNPYGNFDPELWVCNFTNTSIGATIKDYVDMQRFNETTLETVVALIGPIATSMDAEDDLQFYKEGIYYNSHCMDYGFNHAVLVVGYGTTEDKKDYWIIKNSWGAQWGDKGYMKLARNSDNNCAITSWADYPIM